MVRGGTSGSLMAFGSTGHLIVTDTLTNIERVEKILGEVDRPGASRNVDVVRLFHADAEEIARELSLALKGATSAGSSLSRQVHKVTGGGSLLPTDMAVVPVPHANSLVLVGTAVQMAEMKRVVKLIDVESPSAYGRLNAIFLKYLSAEDAAKSLNALLEKTKTKDEPEQRIAIEPSLANNALLVEASPRDYERVRALIEKLDVVPEQVLVEILIAELDINDNLDLGAELATIDLPEDGSTSYYWPKSTRRSRTVARPYRSRNVSSGL